MTLAAGIALGSAALVACSTPDPTPPPASSSAPPASSSSTTTTASPTTSTSSTTTAARDIPEAARANTADGAVAFTNFFLETANEAYKSMDTSGVEALYTNTCAACASIKDSVEEWKGKGYTYDGKFASPTLVTASSFEGNGVARVLVQSENPAGKVKNGAGSVVETIAPEKSSSSVYLQFANNGWRVTEIKVAA